jgi:hypothetical protein
MATTQAGGIACTGFVKAKRYCRKVAVDQLAHLLLPVKQKASGDTAPGCVAARRKRFRSG